jgi:O-antigen/teichoic acid export membrane protein
VSTGYHVVYLLTVASCIISTALLQAPVSVHRALFRRHRRAQTVLIAHRLSIAGTFFLACAVTGVSYLVFAIVENTAAGIAAAAVAAALLATFWLIIPRALRRHEGDDD